MVSVSFAASAALFLALTAVELFRFLHLPSVPSASTSPPQASTLDRAVESTASDIELFFPFLQVLVLLAATGALFAAVAFLHLHNAGGGAMGTGNKRVSEIATFLICGAAGTLKFILFVLQPAAVGDVGALVRALGAAAADALAAAATVTFYLSITLVIAHIRAGGEGGGGDGAVVAGHGRFPAPVDLLKKLTIGAAAALLIQMAMALFFK